MAVWFGLLIFGSYLLGSLPVAYAVGKWLRGIDLRHYGTGQVGTGNLWRMTSSWKVGLPLGIFDFGKGMVMIWAAKVVGLDAAQQLMVGMAAIMGHNWSVFLRFSGGRGIGTAMGVILILPLINDVTYWGMVTFLTITMVGLLIMRSSPLPILVGAASVPVVSWWFHDPLGVTLGFMVMFLIIVTKRLAAPYSDDSVTVTKRQLLLNRLLFDRDIRDRKVWMYRKPIRQKEQSRG